MKFSQRTEGHAIKDVKGRLKKKVVTKRLGNTWMPKGNETYVVVDIETTGGCAEKHAITEIGAVKIRNGQIIGRFENLINPGQDIPWFIQKLTGITPKLVCNAPPVEEILPSFLEFLGDSIFVAHNASFDFRFLDTVIHTYRGYGLKNPSLCTCALSRRVLPGIAKRNLGAIAEHMGIVIENRHRALGDAEATARVLIRFLEALEAKTVEANKAFAEAV